MAASPISAPVIKPENSSRVTKIMRLVVLAALIGGSAYLLYEHSDWFKNPRAMKAEVLTWGAWGPIAYVALYAIGPSFLVPGAVMTIAGGLAFGALWGSIWSLIGANLGALIAFAAGRFLGRSFVAALTPQRFRHLLDRLVRNGFFVILYLRIVPVIPYNALNL